MVDLSTIFLELFNKDFINIFLLLIFWICNLIFHQYCFHISYNVLCVYMYII